MGQSKIKSIQAQGTYQGQSGTVYKFEVELEDGAVGEVGAKTENRWSEGDEVEYTKTDTNWGPKLALQKPGFTPSAPGGGFKRNPVDQKNMENSWALGTAVQVIGQQQIPTDKYLQEVRDMAVALLKERDNLKA